MFPQCLSRTLSLPPHHLGLSPTLLNGVLLNGVGLAGHIALIHGDFAGVDEEAVGGHLHPLRQLHDVAHDELVLVQFDGGAVAEDCDFLAAVGDLVQLQELFLFLVVIDGRHERADHDCDHYCEALDPG